MARQFNLIPPSAEQAEYHLFQREKVEIQMPEMYNKIGQSDTPLPQCFYFYFYSFVGLFYVLMSSDRFSSRILCVVFLYLFFYVLDLFSSV